MVEHFERLLDCIVDYIKAGIDFSKHLTTLAVGTIVVIGAVHGKLTSAAQVRWAIPLAMGLLFVSLIYWLKASSAALRWIGNLIQVRANLFQATLKDPSSALETLKPIMADSKAQARQMDWNSVLGSVTFSAALLLLVFFVFKNMV